MFSHSPFIASARDGAILWARDLINNPDTWVILDTETTGLSGGDEVIQVAVINPSGERLIDEMVKPQVEIDPGAENVHHISKAMLSDKPEFHQIAPLVFGKLDGKKIITYNAAFDKRLLWQTCRVHHLEIDPLKLTWDCAMERYAAFYGEWNPSRRSFRWQKLEGGDHSAGGDCRATLDLIKRMAAAKLSGEVERE